MPKETVTIDRFGGLAGSPDSRDLRPGVAAYCENLDPSFREGLFQGLPEDENIGSFVVTNAAVFDDGTQAAYFSGALGSFASIGVLEDIETNTPASVNLGNAIAGGPGVSDGRSVRFGAGTTADPVWVGDTAGGTSWTALNAIITRPDNNSLLANSTQASDQEEATFPPDLLLFYAVSLVYDDGVQESTLRLNDEYSYGLYTGNATDETLLSNVTVDVELNSGNALRERVTGVALYRKEIPYDEGATADSFGTAWRLVEVKDASSTLTFTDENQIGATYQERTGIPETLEHMDVRYSLSAQMDGYHLVAGVRVVNEGDGWGRMLMRSKRNRFDMFDWSSDYLTLRYAPVALVPYRQRLYCFSRGAVEIVAPGILASEEVLEGAGTLSRESVVATDRGMMFASRHNVYLHDGSSVQPIGGPILVNDTDEAAAYLEQAQSADNIVCGYHAERDLFAVLVEGPSGNSGWAYHPPTQRWTHFQPPSGTLAGKIQTPGGRLLVSIGGILYAMFEATSGGSTLRRPWRFDSHTLSTQGRRATYYEARTFGGGSMPLTWHEDGVQAGTANTLSGTAVTINSNSTNPWQKVREFAFSLEGASSDVVRSVSLTRRQQTTR